MFYMRLIRKHGVLLLSVSAIIIVALAFLLYKKRDSCSMIAKLHYQQLPNKEKADITRAFVDRAVSEAEAFSGPNKELFDRLTEDRSHDGGYLIAYQQSGEDKGTLLLHGVPTKTFCDAEHPLCNDSGQSEVGKNLYNFETVDGIKEVQLWIEIANNGGGWAATYWKDPKGFMKPKYYNIRPVEGKNFFIASGYFS